MAITLKEYAETLKAVIKMQISYLEEDSRYDNNECLQGQAIGLKIALEKINDSQFLIND